MQLASRVALVTGAGRRVGRALAVAPEAQPACEHAAPGTRRAEDQQRAPRLQGGGQRRLEAREETVPRFPGEVAAAELPVARAKGARPPQGFEGAQALVPAPTGDLV